MDLNFPCLASQGVFKGNTNFFLEFLLLALRRDLKCFPSPFHSQEKPEIVF